MLVQFPGKCGHGLAKSLKHQMVFWFQNNLNAMGGVKSHSLKGRGRPWGSTFSHDPITGKHSNANTVNGKQVEQEDWVCSELQ